MEPQNPLQKLANFDQSVWLDYIERSFVRDGRLATLIADAGVSGLTSNPAIFQKAIAEHAVYREPIEAMARSGLAAREIHEALVIDDIRSAADALAEVFRRSAQRDGFVSLEVSPHLARDSAGTYSEAVRLWTLVDRQNLMIKVPGTAAGIPAIRNLIADGINVNVTLLFSVERYAAVAEAFMAGLEDRTARKQDIRNVASVASFFLSRIDTLIDPKLDATDVAQARALRGRCAIACAHAAYAHHQATIAASRWRELKARGARPQRLLWASTGTKNPAYSDVKYVDALVGPETVTTLPPETLAAYRDHGNPMQRLPAVAADAEPSMEEITQWLAAAGIDWSAVALQLEAEGVQKFVQPHDATLATLRERIAALKQ